MDVGEHRGGARLRFDNSREDLSPWNMVNQHHAKEQNVFNMNKKYLNIIAERDAAIEERNRALLEKRKALEEREAAISQRNLAIKERNDAILERDNALSALQHSMSNPTGFGIQGGIKRLAYNPVNQMHRGDPPYGATEMQILDALCKTVVTAECNQPPQGKRTKENMAHGGPAMKLTKGKRVREDLNRQAGSGQLKLKNDWEGQSLGLNRVDYDESVMPIPGCSCTGVFRHCYKWGNGGWQSSCCTTTMSAYPLPPVPNKRYARMGGRKMSGSAFSKLLSRLAAEGYDFSIPVDLKDRWSKHGTNRYITIK